MEKLDDRADNEFKEEAQAVEVMRMEIVTLHHKIVAIGNFLECLKKDVSKVCTLSFRDQAAIDIMGKCAAFIARDSKEEIASYCRNAFDIADALEAERQKRNGEGGGGTITTKVNGAIIGVENV